MQIYKSKYRRLPGTSYSEVYPRALHVYKQALAHTKRQPYVRAQFFAKDKVFLAYFWQHLRQKTSRTGLDGYATLKQRSTSYVIHPMRQPRNKTPMTRMNCCIDLQVLREMTSCSMCRLSKTSRL